ncbi:S-layer family protein, partial [Waterburya agarophytonicola K14]|nr:S-layer family protein [Waterburya agarophytonicola KI4]
ESYPSALYVSAEGTGDGGNLSITGNSLIVKDGGQINSETLDEGNAGNIDITANNILITKSSFNEDFASKITATSESTSAAGSINITSKRLDVTQNAEIAVSNNDLGDAGNLTITTKEINLDISGSLNAEINQGEQGNINLETKNILLNNNSQITAKAFNNATGGNIRINNQENIVLRNNSQIIADAVEGKGGNIEIKTQGLLIDLASKISASSQLGLDGTVEIETIESDRQFELNRLPENVTDLTNLITVTCSANDNNAFAVIGNGGIPHSPYQTQSLSTTWYDLRPVKQESDRVASLPAALTEATATMIDAHGELELVALTPLSTHRWIRSSCSN